MMNRYIIILLLTTTMTSLYAQEKQQAKWEYDIKIGLNIGGNSPLPLPVEIREIKSYSPTFAPSIGADITHHLNKRWGITSGIKLEKKGMSTKARVKNYRTEIVENGNKLKGNWTGNVKTKTTGYYLTLPLLCTYRASEKINIKAGVFLSYLLDGEMSGYVNNGYLRKDNPTGDKVVFDSKTKGTYDFSDEMRKFNWGLQAGADYRITKKLKLFADLAWGLNDTMKDSFKTITFSMYPIYFNLGIGYNL